MPLYRTKIPFKIEIHGRIWKTVESQAENLDEFEDEMRFEHPAYEDVKQLLETKIVEATDRLKVEIPGLGTYETYVTIKFATKSTEPKLELST